MRSTTHDALMLQAFLATTLSPMVATDENGKIVLFNRAAEEQFQTTAGDVMGKNVRRLVPEPFRSEHDSYIRAYKEKQAELGQREGLVPRTVEAQRTDGFIFSALLTVLDVDVMGERIFIASLEDLTEMTLVAEKQVRSEAISRFVMKSQPDGIIVATREGVIQIFSGASEAMFGIKESDAIGQRVEIIMPEPYRSYHPSYIENYVEYGEKTVVDAYVDARAVNSETQEEFPVRVWLYEITLDRSSVFMAVVHNSKEEIEAQEKREKVMNRHKNILNAIVGALFAIDEDGTILICNRGAQEMLGYEEEELLGQNVKMVVPEPYKSEHDNYLSNIRKTGIKKLLGDAEGRAVSAQCSDGSCVAVQIVLTETEVNGQTIYVGLLNDMMDEEKKMEALAKAEAKAHSVIESAVDAIVTCNMNGHIEEFNPAAERMFGWTKKDVIGLKVNLLMPPPYSKMHDGYMQAYYNTGIQKVIGFDREIVGLRKDGSTVPMEIRLSEVIVDNSRTFTAILRDIEERTKMMMKVTKSAERTRRIFDSAQDAIITCDRDGTITDVNNRALEMFMYPEENMVGSNVRILMPSPYYDEHDGYLASYRQTGIQKIIGKVTPREVVGKRSDGSCFPIEINLTESDIGTGVLYTGYLRDISVRKEAEDRVAASIKKTKAIMSGATDGIVVIDDKGQVEMINEAACAMFEISEAILLGQNIKVLMPEPFKGQHDSYLSNYLLTGIRKVIGFNREVSGMRQQSGEIFPISIAISEVNTGSKRVFTGIIRDMTVDKKHHQMLAKKEKQLMAVIEKAVDSVIVINEEGIISTFNPAAEKLWGWSAEEVLGQPVDMLMPEPFRSDHAGFLKTYIKTGVKKVIGSPGREVVIIKKNEEVVPIQISVSESVVGSSWQFTAIVVEITTRKIIEAKLMRSQMQMQMLFETATNGVVTIDEMGVIIEINPAASSMFGYGSKEEILGQNVKVLMPPGVAEKHDDYLAEYKVTGKKSMLGSTREVRGRKKNEDKIDIEISVAESTVGSSRAFQAIIVDITERKKREEAANIRQHQVDQIIATSAFGIISINQRGVIQAMNAAAKQIFLLGDVNMVGEKVNVLMPEPFRSDHDTYISAYLRNKKRNVIGLTRQVHGLRRNIRFPLELAVEESHIFGTYTFIALIRDLTDDKCSMIPQAKQFLVHERPLQEEPQSMNRTEQTKHAKQAFVQGNPMQHYAFKDEWISRY